MIKWESSNERMLIRIAKRELELLNDAELNAPLTIASEFTYKKKKYLVKMELKDLKGELL